MRRRLERGRLEIGLLLAPYALGVIALVAIPAVATFALGLTDWDLLSSPSFVGLDNFEELLRDHVFHQALLNSLIFMAIAVPLRVGAALAAALLLHRRGRGIRAQRTAFYLPTVVPDVAFALLWLYLLNPAFGPVSALLGTLGLPEPDWFTSGVGAMTVVVAMSVFTVGEGFVVALATRQELPEDLHELAVLEGASRFQVLRKVTLPLMKPTLALLAFRDTALTLQATFVPALLVTGGGPDRATLFLPLLTYQNAFENLRYGYAAAMTTTMFLLTALIVGAQARILRLGRLGLAR
jgi:multiple sugar transport system permease protein